MSDLPKRSLGRTGLQVTRLAYGAMELRDDARGRPVSENQARRILNALLDAGINLIDTSIDYGLSEERIGRNIAHRRYEYILATKCGCPLEGPQHLRGGSLVKRLKRSLRASPAWKVLRPRLGARAGVGIDEHVFTRKNIVAGLEQSLARMKTDYVDLLQVHHAPPRAVLESSEAIETLQDLKQQGKVRFIGLSSNVTHAAEHAQMGVFDVIQLPYSAFLRDNEQVLAAAAAQGTGVIVRGGAAGGGRSGLQRNPELHAQWERAGMPAHVGVMSRIEFNIRFTLANPHVDTMLVGTVDPAHLSQNIDAALAGPLPDAALNAAAKAFAPTAR